jgi:hypothetical protein
MVHRSCYQGKPNMSQYIMLRVIVEYIYKYYKNMTNIAYYIDTSVSVQFQRYSAQHNIVSTTAIRYQ